MDKFAIPRKSIYFILIGLACIAIGYLLISGGGSGDKEVFNEAIFSVRRMYIAPLFIVAGFVIEVYAILRKGK